MTIILAAADDLAEFARMVDRHDLTFAYSDDHRHYTAGKASIAAINEFAKRIPRAEAVRIWNAAVDRKLVADVRNDWYWKI